MANNETCSPLVTNQLFPVILQAVCAAYEVTPQEILSGRRVRRCSEPRRVVWWLARAIGRVPFERIGELTGKRHHTSVMHGCILIDAQRAKSRFHRDEIDAIWRTVLAEVEPIVGLGVLAHPEQVAA